MNFETVKAAELQADLIDSVTTQNGVTVVTLKDGTSKVVQDSDGVIARELRGAIDVASGVEGMLAMPAPLNASAEGDQALMDQLAAELAEVEAVAGDEGGAASSSGSGNADSAVQFAVLQGVTTSVDELVAKNAFVSA